jgi:AraC-like DNA-binding protein
MDIRLNIYAVVLLFAFTQGIFYIFLFIKRGIQEERKSDFWMSALIAALCVFNLGWMLGFMGIYVLGQELWFFPHDVGLVIGPIIFYYLKTQINTDFQFTRQDFKHFIPYCVYFIYHLFLFLMGKNMVDWWANKVHNPLHIGDVEIYIAIISACVYMVASWRLYQKYLVWLPIERSDTEGVRFDWYRYFLWAIVLAVVSALVFFVLGFWVELSFREIWIQRVIVAAVIYYISFAGYVQAQPRHLVFEEKKESSEPFTDLAVVENETKIESKIEPLELEKWKTKIENIMQKDKLFLNSELTLSELSDKLNSHNSLISNVINTVFQKNFNDFVNEFRVNVFKEKINDPKLKHLTLLAIAFDCGFNSKSTFNRAVKKATGQMPSDFMVKM